MNTSVRLVRCPRCRKVLPELPEIPVYMCGGCSTILQAKNQRYSVIGESSGAPETNPTQKYESDSASDCPNQEDNLPSIEPSSESVTRGVQSESRSLNSEKAGDTEFSGDHPFSNEQSCHSNGKLPQEAKESLEQGELRNPVVQDVESLASSREKSHGITSNELRSLDNGDSSTEIKEYSKHDEGRSSLEPNNGINENEIADCHSVSAEDEKCSDEPQGSDESSYRRTKICIAASDKEQYLSQGHTEYRKCEDAGDNFHGDSPLTSEGKHQYQLSLVKEEHCNHIRGDNNGKSQNGFPRQNEKSFQKIESGQETSSFAVVDCHKVGTSVIVAKDYSDVDENNGHLEGSLNLEKGNINTAAQGPLNEGIISKSPSPNDKYLKNTQKMVHCSDWAGSNEMLETLPINPRTPIGSMSKSPTKIYYGCDASESSYDGTDVSAQVSHLYKRKIKGSGNLSTSRTRQKDGIRFNEMQTSEFKAHHEPTAPVSMFTEKTNSSATEQEWRHQEFPESRKHRSTTRSAENEPASSMSYMSRTSQLFHGNGNPSSSRHYVSEHHSRSHSPDTTLGADPDKMELLRMVYELEDKLSRTHTSKQMADRRFLAEVYGEEKRASKYYDDLATEGNAYVNFKHSGHHGSHPQGVGWAHQDKISRLGFSGEATQRRHKIDYICSQCCHQDWHCSTKLSPHCIHCRKGQYMIPAGHDYGNVNHTSSSSPQHFTSSEFSSWSHDMKADYQKYNEHDLKKLYLREKYQVAKQHLRPLVGGAPIIACCHCSELLKLPVDFLLFKRRCHQLRCNSCNKILKFSLQKKVHLVPYVPNASAPPPSEMEDYSGVENNTILASELHSTRRQSAVPVSCSDDHEPFFSRSGSTEGEAPLLPLSVLKITKNGKMPSGNSFQPMADREMKSAPRKVQNVNKRSDNNFKTGEPSSRASKRENSSSEIELLPAASGSPLHRLMGYESPRQVLFASPVDESDDEMDYMYHKHT